MADLVLVLAETTNLGWPDAAVLITAAIVLGVTGWRALAPDPDVTIWFKPDPPPLEQAWKDKDKGKKAGDPP